MFWRAQGGLPVAPREYAQKIRGPNLFDLFSSAYDHLDIHIACVCIGSASQLKEGAGCQDCWELRRHPDCQ